MAILIGPKGLWQNEKSKVRMFRDYLVNRLYLQKINLKKPLSKGRHLNIYFRLECRENWGSRQNFHGISFSKDRVLINPGHWVLKILSLLFLVKQSHEIDVILNMIQQFLKCMDNQIHALVKQNVNFNKQKGGTYKNVLNEFERVHKFANFLPFALPFFLSIFSFFPFFFMEELLCTTCFTPSNVPSLFSKHS